MRGGFKPERILEVLMGERVEFVVGGDYAGILHGARFATADLDVLVHYDPRNLGRLSRALRRLDARVWAPDVHEAAVRARRLLAAAVDGAQPGDQARAAGRRGGLERGRRLRPGAPAGYRVQVGRGPVAVLTVEALLAAKQAAGRDQDRRKLQLVRERR